MFARKLRNKADGQYFTIENLGPEGQSVGRRKSVKKNAALLHFLAFSLADLPFGVPRGRAPLGGVRCLATARLFSLPFLVTKKVGLGKRQLISRCPPHGGGTPEAAR